MNNGGERTAEDMSEQADDQEKSGSTGAVDIKASDTGLDPEVGHTPGKAEGDETES